MQFLRSRTRAKIGGAGGKEEAGSLLLGIAVRDKESSQKDDHAQDYRNY